MSWFLDRLVLDGERFDARIEHNVVTGEHLRTMEGASTVTLTVHDPDRELITSGIFTHQPRTRSRSKSGPFPGATQLRVGDTRLVLDSKDPYLLAGYNKTGSNLELRFEHEIVSLMRRHNQPLVVARDSYTRAQFILYKLVAAVKTRNIATFIPSLTKKQPTKHPDIPKQKIDQTSSFVEFNGVKANKDQIHNINLVMQAIHETGADDKAALALIEACIVEPAVPPSYPFGNPTFGDSSSVGILQLLDIHLGGSTSTSGGRRDVKLVAKLFLTKGFAGNGGAIEIASKHPAFTPGDVAGLVQGPRADLVHRYEDHRAEADAVLNAGGGSGGSVYVPEKYMYTVGDLNWQQGDAPREDYWSAAVRLADEVNWNLYVSDNRLFYCDDRDLFKGAPVAVVAEFPSKRQRRNGVQYVGNIDYDTHYNKRVQEVHFQARADQFFAFPGATIEILGIGQGSGKYLISEIRDTIGRFDVEIVCRRPEIQKPEPAPTLTSVSLPSSDTPPESIRGNLKYPLPIHGKVVGWPGEGTHNGKPPYDNWQSKNAIDIAVPRGTPVLAVEDGTITKVAGGWHGGASRTDGWQITLQTSTNTWWYQHNMTHLVEVGDRVTAGQRIATSGAGNSVDHLHIACQRGRPDVLLGVSRLPKPTTTNQQRNPGYPQNSGYTPPGG